MCEAAVASIQDTTGIVTWTSAINTPRCVNMSSAAGRSGGPGLRSTVLMKPLLPSTMITNSAHDLAREQRRDRHDRMKDQQAVAHAHHAT